MKLQILHVPGCPNTGVLIARLDQTLAGPGPVEVESRPIHDQDEAIRWGMMGSPTLLIDGVDPFVVPGQAANLSCRLYLDEAGTVSGTPSLMQLRAALVSHRRPWSAPAGVNDASCCGT